MLDTGTIQIEDANLHSTEVILDFVDPHRAALEDNPDTAERPPFPTILAVFFIALSPLPCIGCGFVLISAILVQIGEALGNTHKMAWVVGGWSVASSVSFSIAGNISDTFGRRWTILVGHVFCIVGLTVAATAHSMNSLIIGSTFIGFSTGFLLTCYAGVSELLPNKWRGAGIALVELFISLPFGVPNVIIATELLSKTALGWRWCYYIGLICCVFAMVGTSLTYFPPSKPQHNQHTKWEDFKQADFVGILLYTGGLTTFLVGITWAGQPEHPWKSGSVIAPLAIGLVVFTLAFVYDFTLAKQPLFPIHLFVKIRDFTVLLGITFMAGVIYYSMSALLPAGTLYMFTNDPIQIGLIALPNGVAQFLFGVVASAFLGRLKHVRLQMLIALTFQVISTACLAAVIPHDKAGWAALQVFSIGPFTFVTAASYLTASVNVPLRYLGLAFGLLGTFRSMGGSIGNAIFNTVLNGVVNKHLTKDIASAAIMNGFDPSGLGALIPATIQAAVGVPGAFSKVPGITPAVQVAAQQAFREVYAKGFRMVFFSTIPFGVIAIILAYCMLDPSQYLTNHTAVHMERTGVLGNKPQKPHSEQCSK